MEVGQTTRASSRHSGSTPGPEGQLAAAIHLMPAGRSAPIRARSKVAQQPSTRLSRVDLALSCVRHVRLYGARLRAFLCGKCSIEASVDGKNRPS